MNIEVMKWVDKLFFMTVLFAANFQLTYAEMNYDTLRVNSGAGSLRTVLSYYNGGLDTKHLVVRGKMNGEDFSFVRSLSRIYSLKSLDISDVSVVASGIYEHGVSEDNTLNRGIFDDFILDYIILPKTLKLIRTITILQYNQRRNNLLLHFLNIHNVFLLQLN